ncbi:hypothetical protein HW932_21285 [Allochromatium humboldtianum]|uniref:Uncharacterized protein n=1 Tax=Allochromatium humboldtianum TaxID=504901 RepID=A0A850RLM9_9GAMM|nr:hypothetical protein [Allochromatium humboldtianum]NVZ11780.1 hypothetical protein [Allochromatium humboldtianum]
MSQSMRFRLFINQAEGKMWAIGVYSVDPESGHTGSWMTMWGPLNKVDTHIGSGYWFSHIGKLKPLDDYDAVRRLIKSKLAKGYTEKRVSLIDDWEFVPYPKYGTQQGRSKMLVAESDLPVRSKSTAPVADHPTVVHDGTALTLPNAEDLNAAGYAQISL